MGAAQSFAEMMRAQRGALFGWIPVCLAIGIGGYFQLGFEPTMLHLGRVGSLACFAQLLQKGCRNLHVLLQQREC